MADTEELRARRAALRQESDKIFSNVGALAEESERVADVVQYAPTILKNLDREFELQTKLRGKDIGFLFFAVALQCCRQYLLTNFKERLGDQEAADKTPLKDVLDPHDLQQRSKAGFDVRHHRLYNPTLDEIILHPVPFDTARGADGFNGPLAGGGSLGHRATVLGHDPILGLIFGTANIATITLTTWNFRSFHISSKLGSGDFLQCQADTFKVMEHFSSKLLSKSLEDKKIVCASLVKEIVHLNSDVHSKNSLPIPFVSAFDPKMASALAEHGLDMENVLTVGKQAVFSEMINMLISLLHALTYNEEKDGDKKLFGVRTRRIVTYSNVIASASNVIVVAVGSVLGLATKDPKLIQKSLSLLDIGGFLVTIMRLITDRTFIQEVKNEFIMENFCKMIAGDFE